METTVCWTLPLWLKEVMSSLPIEIPDEADRMALVLSLARQNFQGERDGGPFAAAVFERDSGHLIAVGTNQVLATGSTSAHAEILALSLAQAAIGTWDLGEPSLPSHQLVVSWRPCAMCLGAVVWSGVRYLLVAGEDDEVARAAGFDEGPVMDDWPEELDRRGIQVEHGLLGHEAAEILAAFSRAGSPTYSPRPPHHRDR